MSVCVSNIGNSICVDVRVCINTCVMSVSVFVSMSVSMIVSLFISVSVSMFVSVSVSAV